MPIFEIKGIKEDHKIAEQAHSLTKAQWVAAMYVESGYQVQIVELTPLTSGSL